MKLLILNGPNLNFLGKREPEIYGQETLDDIESFTNGEVKDLNLDLEWFQSNLEGALIDKIQEACNNGCDGIVINPGGYSHTSIAIHDALKAFPNKVVEVHYSNTQHREEFRKKKVTGMASWALLEGLGRWAYYFGIMALVKGKN